MSQRGLDQDGLIVREGSLSRVPDTFAPVVDAARTQITAAFREQRLHSAYLYGSIPRGTAIPEVSDLDLMLALHHEPAAADRADADAIEAALDLAFAQIDGVGIGLCRACTLLSELERHDLGFFVACLCTPLLGEDLAAHLPRYRPDSLLARETNGDLGLALARWRLAGDRIHRHSRPEGPASLSRPTEPPAELAERAVAVRRLADWHVGVVLAVHDQHRGADLRGEGDRAEPVSEPLPAGTAR